MQPMDLELIYCLFLLLSTLLFIWLWVCYCWLKGFEKRIDCIGNDLGSKDKVQHKYLLDSIQAKIDTLTTIKNARERGESDCYVSDICNDTILKLYELGEDISVVGVSGGKVIYRVKNKLSV